MSAADSAPAVTKRDFAEAGMRAAPNQMRPSAMIVTRSRTIDSNDSRYPGIWGVMVRLHRLSCHYMSDSDYVYTSQLTCS